MLHGVLYPEAHGNRLQKKKEALSEFLIDCTSDVEEWNLCFRCMTECHMPCSEDDWKAHVLTCGHILQAARDTIVNEGVRRTNQEIDDFLETRRALAYDMVINQLVSDHAPSFDHLLGDPRLVEWAGRLHENMSHYYQETLTTDSTSTLHPTIRDRLDANARRR